MSVADEDAAGKLLYHAQGPTLHPEEGEVDRTDAPQSGDRAQSWRVPGFDGIELFYATYARHTFARHTHQTLAIGVVDAGAGEFWCRGATYRAGADTLVLINSGDPHTGGVAPGSGEPLRYGMLYLGVDLLSSLFAGDGGPARRFHANAPFDPSLASALRRLHQSLRFMEDPLECEAALVAVLSRLFKRYGTKIPDRETCGSEPQAVARIREYLNAHLAERISGRELGELVGLHPAYVNRVFKSVVGLPPHEYLTQLRVARAKSLLSNGETACEVAYKTGFADQSHLTRHFKKSQGVTPAAYRRHVTAGQHGAQGGTNRTLGAR